MAWQTPKTTWGQPGQTVPRVADFNRIEGNIQELENTKETPSEAQAKADTAEAKAKAYADNVGTAAITAANNYTDQEVTKIANNLTSHKNENATGAHKAKNISLQSINFEANNVEDGMNELFTSVSNGKNAIATAITDKGVSAIGSDTFEVLANKIGQIKVGDYKKGDAISAQTLGFLVPLSLRLGFFNSSIPLSQFEAGLFDVNKNALTLAYSSSNTVYLKLFELDFSMGLATKLAEYTIGMAYEGESLLAGDYLYIFDNDYFYSGQCAITIYNASTGATVKSRTELSGLVAANYHYPHIFKDYGRPNFNYIFVSIRGVVRIYTPDFNTLYKEISINANSSSDNSIKAYDGYLYYTDSGVLYKQSYEGSTTLSVDTGLSSSGFPFVIIPNDGIYCYTYNKIKKYSIDTLTLIGEISYSNMNVRAIEGASNSDKILITVFNSSAQYLFQDILNKSNLSKVAETYVTVDGSSDYTSGNVIYSKNANMTSVYGKYTLLNDVAFIDLKLAEFTLN